MKRLAPFFVLGPITGPLVAGVVVNVARGNWVLASMYAVAVVELSLLVPAWAVMLTAEAAQAAQLR